jgi:glycosyltransferase involved in cell wall biosynthesis
VRAAPRRARRYKEDVLACLLAKRLGTVATCAARLRAAFDFLVFRFFSAVVAVSVEMKQTLVSGHGLHADRVEVIRRGRRFSNRTSEPRASGEPLQIGTVARMVPVKGLLPFLEAAAVLRRQAPRVRLSILGDSTLRESPIRAPRRLASPTAPSSWRPARMCSSRSTCT